MLNVVQTKNPNKLIISELGFYFVDCVIQLSNNILDDLTLFYEMIVALEREL